MGFGQCSLVLDSPNLSYYAGQTIFGKLECQLDKVKEFRGIYVKAEGVANVHWSTDHTRKVNDRTTHYKKHHNAREEYFTHKQYLIGSDRGESKLKPGRHEYPFQIHIPAHCPSSFEGKYGHIRYSIKAVVDRAFKVDNEVHTDVRVVTPVDLDLDPTSKNPMVFEFSEVYCCWCMSSGEVEVLVKLPASGYCPGQIIPAEVVCKNNSSVDIHNIKLRLRKHITFHAHHEPGTKSEEAVISEIKKGPIKQHTTKEWLVEMEVPVVDACNVDGCRIIDVVYKFKVTVNPEGCHTKTSESKVIKLGTTPVSGTDNRGPDPLETPMPERMMAEIPEYMVAPAYNPQYQTSNTPYPGANPPYPGANPPYPGSNPPYPGANTPYPGANPPYAGNMAPYPEANPPYAGNQAPYPEANPPYAGNKAPYPEANPPYAGNQAPYPEANPPYAGNKAPYPEANPPYPGANPPYPGANPPYPGANPPYSAANSYPHPIPPIFGFRADLEHQNAAPAMPMPIGQPLTWNQASPSAPVPSTPITEYPDTKPVMSDGDSSPYNPAFLGKQ